MCTIKVIYIFFAECRCRTICTFADMKPVTIADEFFENKPELLNEIHSFERRRKLQLMDKLQKEEDAVNFFSTLAEIRTGLFFDPLCSALRYNVPLNGKRPDWLLTLTGQNILCEVLRLNTPEEENKASIERNRELARFQQQNPGAPIMEYSGAKVIETEFLCGAQWKLQVKEEKYRGIITRHKLPYIICVNPSLQTYINKTDLSDFLTGRHGFFATDDNFGRNITGVLLQGYFAGHWSYFPNKRAEYKLTDENEKVTGEWRS